MTLVPSSSGSDDEFGIDYGGYAYSATHEDRAPVGPTREGVSEELILSQEGQPLGRFLRARVALDLRGFSQSSAVDIPLSEDVTVPIHVFVTRGFLYKAMLDAARNQQLLVECADVKECVQQTLLANGAPSQMTPELQAAKDHLIVQHKGKMKSRVPVDLQMNKDETLPQCAKRHAVETLNTYFELMLGMAINTSDLDLVQRVYRHLQSPEMIAYVEKNHDSERDVTALLPRPDGMDDDWIQTANELQRNVTAVLSATTERLLNDLRMKQKLVIDMQDISDSISAAVRDSA